MTGDRTTIAAIVTTLAVGAAIGWLACWGLSVGRYQITTAGDDPRIAFIVDTRTGKVWQAQEHGDPRGILDLGSPKRWRGFRPIGGRITGDRPSASAGRRLMQVSFV